MQALRDEGGPGQRGAVLLPAGGGDEVPARRHSLGPGKWEHSYRCEYVNGRPAVGPFAVPTWLRYEGRGNSQDRLPDSELLS